LTPNELVLTTSVPIRKSIKKCDRESAHERTHPDTHTHADANCLYNMSHAIWQIKMRRLTLFKDSLNLIKEVKSTIIDGGMEVVRNRR